MKRDAPQCFCTPRASPPRSQRTTGLDKRQSANSDTPSPVSQPLFIKTFCNTSLQIDQSVRYVSKNQLGGEMENKALNFPGWKILDMLGHSLLCVVICSCLSGDVFAEVWAICHPNWQCLVGKSCVWEKHFSAPCQNPVAFLLSKMDSWVNTSIHRCDYPGFACSSQFILNILQCSADGIYSVINFFSFIFLYRWWRSAATINVINLQGCTYPVWPSHQGPDLS